MRPVEPKGPMSRVEKLSLRRSEIYSRGRDVVSDYFGKVSTFVPGTVRIVVVEKE